MPKLRVMIVEDEGLIAIDIASQLQKGGYQVVATAASGKEALALIQTVAADLVLMDIHLKGSMDGIDTAAQMRSVHSLPVIFLTAYSDDETLARAKQAEPFGFLMKPCQPASLRSAIEMGVYKHRSERALMEREAWLTTVLQSIGDPTIITNAEGLIQFVNISAEQLLGCQLPDVVGLKWTEVVSLFDQVPGSQADDWASMAMLQLSTLKLPPGIFLRRKDGLAIAIEGTVSPSVLRGRLAGAVVVIRDVSDRNREEREVRHEQTMLASGRMAASVAHEFNDLLTVIAGHATLLAECMTDSESINAIQEATDAARGITRQLLALSGNEVQSTEVMDVNESAARIARLLAPTLRDGVRLAMDLDCGTGKIRINPKQLDEMLMNLLLNARDATTTAGTILVSTSNVDRYVTKSCGEMKESFVRITVTDSGIGMSRELQEHIFEPFFTTKPQGKGAGLGLAMVYGILKDAAGSIAVESSPGAGASFEILVSRVEESAPSGRGKTTLPLAGSNPKTILLVEGQATTRALIHNYLEQKGFNLIEAENGQEALKLAGMYEGRIDALISNVRRPDDSDLFRELAVTHPKMQVLLLSSESDSDAKSIQGPESRALLSKPFTLLGLFEKVQEILV